MLVLARRACAFARPADVPRISKAQCEPAARVLRACVRSGDATLPSLAADATHAAGPGSADVLAWLRSGGAADAAALAAADAAPGVALAAAERRAARRGVRAVDGDPAGRAAADALKARARVDMEHAPSFAKQLTGVMVRRACAVLHSPTDARSAWLAARCCFTQDSEDGEGGTRVHTVGLFAMLGAPELLVSYAPGPGAAEPPLPPRIAARLSELLLAAATDTIADAAAADASRGAALAREGFVVAEQEARVLLTLLRETAAGSGGGGADATLLARAAGWPLFWRFAPPDADDAAHALFGARTGAVAGLLARVAGTHVGGDAMPWLRCDLAATLDVGALIGRRATVTGRALYAALATARGGLGAARERGGPDDASCANCEHCRAARRTGTMCARPGCEIRAINGGPLKRCARCRTVAYCGALCQKLDCLRHKRGECSGGDAT